MYADAVNPAAFIQPQYTETGAPPIPPAPVNPASVTPLFNLPDQGSRLDEKRHPDHSKYADTEGVPEEESGPAELFQLTTNARFYDLLRSFLINGLGQLVLLRDQWRRQLGIKPYTFATQATRQSPLMPPARDQSYNSILAFHQNPPGRRFTGGM